jgi:hypothetical protein
MEKTISFDNDPKIQHLELSTFLPMWFAVDLVRILYRIKGMHMLCVCLIDSVPLSSLCFKFCCQTFKKEDLKEATVAWFWVWKRIFKLWWWWCGHHEYLGVGVRTWPKFISTESRYREAPFFTRQVSKYEAELEVATGALWCSRQVIDPVLNEGRKGCPGEIQDHRSKGSQDYIRWSTSKIVSRGHGLGARPLIFREAFRIPFAFLIFL